MYAPATLSEFNSSGLGVASNVVGWAICNGNNLTPDLTGKFVVGYNPSDADYSTIGNTGGQKSVTQVLEHSHFVVQSSQVGGSAPAVSATNTIAVSAADGAASQNYDMKAVVGQVANIGLTSKTGSTAPDNRPPYYTVLYIKKIS
jgi:microcystin-dependent protein